MNTILSFIRSNSNLFVFIALLLGSGVFSHLLTDNYSIDGGRKQIALSGKLLLAISYLIATGMVLVFAEEFKKKITCMLWIWLALVFWSAVSLVIGQFNIHTIMRLMGFVGCFFIGLTLFVCLKDVRQLVIQMFYVCLTIVIINIIHIDWSVFVDISSNNIKGVFIQKNVLGQMSFLTLFICAFTFMVSRNWTSKISLILFVVASWLLFLSTSMTSNLLVPIAIFSVLAVLVIWRYQLGWLYVAGGAVFLAVLLIVNWADFFALIGKSTTFTGRTNHWSEYWALIEQRFTVGHGYGAYPENQSYWLKVGAHNGYIELTYQLGVIGLLLMVGIIGFTLRNWWGIVKEKSLVYESCFLFSFLVVFLVVNTMETYMLHRSGLYWPLFIYVTLQLSFLSKQLFDKQPIGE